MRNFIDIMVAFIINNSESDVPWSQDLIVLRISDESLALLYQCTCY